MGKQNIIRAIILSEKHTTDGVEGRLHKIRKIFWEILNREQKLTDGNTIGEITLPTE